MRTISGCRGPRRRRASRPAETRALNAHVWIDPGRLSGEPCVGGSRLPVYLVAGVTWEHGVEEAIDQWELNRPQVLVACWFVAAYNLDHLHKDTGGYVRDHRSCRWRDRWGVWATASHVALWSHRYDDVTDPPRNEQALRATCVAGQP